QREAPCAEEYREQEPEHTITVGLPVGGGSEDESREGAVQRVRGSEEDHSTDISQDRCRPPSQQAVHEQRQAPYALQPRHLIARHETANEESRCPVGDR